MRADGCLLLADEKDESRGAAPIAPGCPRWSRCGEDYVPKYAAATMTATTAEMRIGGSYYR